jgi:hypothetical protein
MRKCLVLNLPSSLALVCACAMNNTQASCSTQKKCSVQTEEEEEEEKRMERVPCLGYCCCNDDMSSDCIWQSRRATTDENRLGYSLDEFACEQRFVMSDGDKQFRQAHPRLVLLCSKLVTISLHIHHHTRFFLPRKRKKGGGREHGLACGHE